MSFQLKEKHLKELKFNQNEILIESFQRFVDRKCPNQHNCNTFGNNEGNLKFVKRTESKLCNVKIL
jgi:hypothetical protein